MITLDDIKAVKESMDAANVPMEDRPVYLHGKDGNFTLLKAGKADFMSLRELFPALKGKNDET